MVDIRVGDRRVAAVLMHEAVDDAARLPAAERPRQLGPATGAQRRAMSRRGTRLSRQHQGAADLGSDRAGTQDRGNRLAVGDAAGADQRKLNVAGDEPQEREQSKVLRLRSVDEIAPVATGLKPLDDEGVGTDGLRLKRLIRARHRHPHVAAGAVQALHHISRWAAERERDNRDAFRGSQLDLLLQ